MKLSKKEREKLKNELRELTTPKPGMTMGDLKVVELRGAEILAELIVIPLNSLESGFHLSVPF